MIKINLLESVTDNQGSVAAVEQKVTSPLIQTLLLFLVVMGLLTAGMAYDYVSSRWAKEAAQKELDKQERIYQEMLAVTKQQEEIKKKTQDIQVRIDAIQQLRASQQGPVAVLKEIKDRFDNVPGLYLKSVEQKDKELIIKGESPNEQSVTNFGKSLEFSNGLFSNLNIETERQIVAPVAQKGAPAPQPGDEEMPKPEVVNFTIKCTYNPTANAPQPQQAQPPSPTNQVAQK
ncbi:MAG: PilN domain-containing protein [Pyrinomonadaceae bacterium]